MYLYNSKSNSTAVSAPNQNGWVKTLKIIEPKCGVRI